MATTETNIHRSPDVVLPSPVVMPGHNYNSVNTVISRTILTDVIGPYWALGVLVCGAFAGLLALALTWLLIRGVGIWGINMPVAWGFAIINFVWWVGIGHAGTFISAILLLVKQEWRTSINRFAEAMTLFAVACAGMFPAIHTGRPWYDYWLLPYPNTMLLWPQFRSPLAWDVFAVSTYASMSLVFWYIGLLPDFATMRDKCQNIIGKRIYGAASLGWRNSARHWQRYQSAYLLLGGLCAPLVISVHSVVSLDFAAGQIPGWHTTIFPPYFVAGAIYSGFAMVLTLAIPLRAAYGLKDFVTMRHLENCAKLMLVTGLIVAYGYGQEAFSGWFSGDKFEHFLSINRFEGPMSWSYWMLIACNIVIPQLLWFKSVRTNVYWLWTLSIVVNVGMWLERFVIVVTSLHRDWLPASWGMYRATQWDWATYLGTLGFFMLCFLLFVRMIPTISIFEMRELVHHKESHGHGSHGEAAH